MKRDFQKQYNDSLHAIELDDTYIKAYMVHGEALVELGKTDQKSSARIEKGIQRLKKALSMCFKQNQRAFEKEIETQIKKANKIKWYKDNEIANFDKSLLVSQLHSKLGGDSDIMNRFESYLNKPKDAEELKQ